MTSVAILTVHPPRAVLGPTKLTHSYLSYLAHTVNRLRGRISFKATQKCKMSSAPPPCFHNALLTLRGHAERHMKWRSTKTQTGKKKSYGGSLLYARESRCLIMLPSASDWSQKCQCFLPNPYHVITSNIASSWRRCRIDCTSSTFKAKRSMSTTIYLLHLVFRHSIVFGAPNACGTRSLLPPSCKFFITRHLRFD